MLKAQEHTMFTPCWLSLLIQFDQHRQCDVNSKLKSNRRYISGENFILNAQHELREH